MGVFYGRQKFTRPYVQAGRTGAKKWRSYVRTYGRSWRPVRTGSVYRL